MSAKLLFVSGSFEALVSVGSTAKEAWVGKSLLWHLRNAAAILAAWLVDATSRGFDGRLESGEVLH